MSTLNVSNITDGTDTVETGYVLNGSAKVWCNFKGTSTVSIYNSLNTSSITDVNTGYYTTNFTNNFNSADYSYNATADGTHNGSICSVGHGDGDNTPLAVGSTRVEVRGGENNGAPKDAVYVMITALGDLA